MLKPPPKAPDISIHDAAEEGNIEAVKQHIAAGTDVNGNREDGITPLHGAAYEGHKEIVELLIANGADVNAKTGMNAWTPLHWAVEYGYTEIAELLIAEGAYVNARNGYGQTPLDWANSRAIRRKHPETVDLLRKHGGKTAEELEAGN